MLSCNLSAEKKKLSPDKDNISAPNENISASNENLSADKEDLERTWLPIFSGNVGVLVISNVGESKTFPIRNPVTEERYVYKPHHKTKTQFFAGIFVGFEKDLLNNFSIQCGLSYNQSANFKTRGTFTQGADIRSENRYFYHYKTRIRQLLVQAKLFYNGYCNLRPYVSLGLGASFNQAYNYATSVPPFLTFTRMYHGHKTTPFAYNIGLGVDFDVTGWLRVGIGYFFSDYGKAGLGRASIDGIRVKGTLSQQHLYSNAFFGGVTYVF
jgi:opacity protein-like surface antigen